MEKMKTRCICVAPGHANERMLPIMKVIFKMEKVVL